MRSMTGFGKGVAEKDGRKITVELRSVNHRFLDVSTKFPRTLVCCEDMVRKVIGSRLSRGHVDVFVTYEDNRQGKSDISVDLVTAARYKEIASLLEGIGFTDDLTVSAVLKMPEVTSLKGEDDDEEAICLLAKAATEEACDKLVEMRTV